MGACHPAKDCPVIASMISDKDPGVRKSALSTLRFVIEFDFLSSISHEFVSEIYLLEGEKVWSYVGSLSPKDKTQLEERLRRVVAGPSTPDRREFGKDALQPQPSQISRLTGSIARPASPSSSLPRPGGIPRSGSPPTGGPRIAQPASTRSASPGPSQIGKPTSHISGPTSPPSRGKSMLPSRLAAPRSRAGTLRSTLVPSTDPGATYSNSNGTKDTNGQSSKIESWRSAETPGDPEASPDTASGITLTISSILSSDSDRKIGRAHV